MSEHDHHIIRQIRAMESLSPKGNCCSSVSSSPYSSPNLTALIKIKIISWSQETGLPANVRVRVGDKIFNLHKLPLSSKSGYFKHHLESSMDITLPPNFPGGPDTFEMIVLFIYDSSTFINTFNVASLRCAAEFLQMTADHTTTSTNNNLCDRTDLYINQVVLQSWEDTLIVLQKCRTLLPWSEDLIIISRCIESLAFMACMEILDPERNPHRQALSLNTLVAMQPWKRRSGKHEEEEVAYEDLWIKDLISLQFEFFKRVMGSLRRHGMKEMYVSPIILLYANKWVITKNNAANQFWECLCDGDGNHSDNNNNEDEDVNMELEVLRGVLDILPASDKGGREIPIGFYFALLDRSLELRLEETDSRRTRIQDQIIALLPSAVVEDFLIPKNVVASILTSSPSSSSSAGYSQELAIMRSIFSAYVSSCNLDGSLMEDCSIVGDLWDAYLAKLVSDPNMSPQMFVELVEVVPLSYRHTHDHLYRAMTVFLQAHPDLSQEQKNMVCKYLKCQNLSQEICIEAVQNDLMPLRLIVQALFVQQLNTQKAFRDCSESFRHTHDFSGSILSSRHMNLGESPLIDGSGIAEGGSTKPQSCKELEKFDFPGKEYECASFRLENLEQEVLCLKKGFQMKSNEGENDVPQSLKMSGLGGRSMSNRKRILGGATTGCIGSINFNSQRRYANRILRVFKRMIMFGKGKPKRGPAETLIMVSVEHTNSSEIVATADQHMVR